MPSSWHIFFATIYHYLTLTVATDQPAILGTYSPYEELRTCAQPCLGGYDVASQIVFVIGCPAPYYDSCYCRGMQDLAFTVTSFLSSCVNSGCSSNPVDLASVFACYDSYCEGKGISHIANNEVTTTQEVAATNVITTYQIVAQPTANNEITQTATSNPGSSGSGSGSGSFGGTNSGSSGLALSDKIALGVGIGIGVPSLIATVAVCLGWGRHRGLA